MIVSERPRRSLTWRSRPCDVDFPANRRTFLVIKRANDKSTFTEALAALFKRENKQGPVSLIRSSIYHLGRQWWRLNDALRTSIRSIIESDAENKVELAQESVQQYAENLLGLVTRVAKGLIVTSVTLSGMQHNLVALVEAVERRTLPSLS